MILVGLPKIIRDRDTPVRQRNTLVLLPRQYPRLVYLINLRSGSQPPFLECAITHMAVYYGELNVFIHLSRRCVLNPIEHMDAQNR